MSGILSLRFAASRTVSFPTHSTHLFNRGHRSNLSLCIFRQLQHLHTQKPLVWRTQWFVPLRCLVSNRSHVMMQCIRRCSNSAKVKKRLPKKSEAMKLLSLAKPERWRLFVAVCCLFISSGAMLVAPYGIGRVIDITYSEKEDSDKMISTLKSFCFILLGVFILGGVANYGRVYLIITASQRIVYRLRSKLFGSIIKQEMGFFDKTRTGELINRLSTDTTLVGQSVSQNVSDGLRAIVSSVGAVGMMLYVSPQLTGMAMCFIPAIGVITTVYGRYMRNITRRVQDSLAKSTQVAEERIGNMRTVRSFSHEQYEYSAYDKAVNDVLNLSYKDAKARALFFGFTGLSGNMIVLSVFYYGGILTTQSLLTVGQLSSFMLYAATAGIGMNRFMSFYTELMKGLGASTRIWELIERDPVIPVTGGSVLSDLKGEVALKGVSFSYPLRTDIEVLSDLTLTVHPGNILAVVGHSGSGKSTITSLLLRFYDPQKGTISIDNVDIKSLDAYALRQQIGVVSQEPSLFSTSIRDNIAYGALDPSAVSDDLIHEAAEQANAINFIRSFPEGFDTIVGERGIMLSGGQKQRIAIARAILKNPKILILDEATSALDVESEYLVQEAMRRVMEKRTVITIAHRLSTIKHAHCISVLDHGRIVESGSYQSLMEIPDGRFRQLVQRQTFDSH